MITDEQWDAVKIRVDKLKDAYLILSQIPGMKTSINIIINPLLERYENGERTQELYNEMIMV